MFLWPCASSYANICVLFKIFFHALYEEKGMHYENDQFALLVHCKQSKEKQMKKGFDILSWKIKFESPWTLESCFVGKNVNYTHMYYILTDKN